MKKVLASLVFILMFFSVSFAAEVSLDPSFIKKLNVSGSLRLRYSALEAGNQMDAFSLSRARIKITGDLASDCSFLVQPDFSALSTGGNLALADAYVEFKNIYKNVKSLKIGQFLVPFGYDSGKYKTIYGTNLNPYYYNTIISARDYGIRASGIVPLLSNIYFDGAIVNGTGGVETNKTKDLAGRINFKNDILDLGVSGYAGKATAASLSKGDLGVDLEIKANPCLIVAEYLNGENTLATAQITDTYLQLSCLINNNYEPLIKYEEYDPNINQTNNKVNTYTLGLNYVFDSNRKLLVNYNINAEETAQINNNSLLVELQMQI